MDINIKYQVIPKELAHASVNFLNKRPFIKFVKLTINVCCVLAIAVAAMKYQANIIRLNDFLFIGFALAWLFSFNLCIYTIIFWIMKLTMRRAATIAYNITTTRLQLQNEGKVVNNQLWKQLKKIYLNKNGYIVPFAGMMKGGKFAWLPKRSFTSEQEEKFLAHLNNAGIKLITI